MREIDLDNENLDRHFNVSPFFVLLLINKQDYAADDVIDDISRFHDKTNALQAASREVHSSR